MIKKLLATLAIASVASFAQAQTYSFDAGGTVGFESPVSANGNVSLNFSFADLAPGFYELTGYVTGLFFNIQTATFSDALNNASTLTINKPESKVYYGVIEYTGLSPYTLSITGSPVGGGDSLIRGYLSASAVSPVPEPESIAMMLAGLGVIGAVVRRRNRAAQPVAAAA